MLDSTEGFSYTIGRMEIWNLEHRMGSIDFITIKASDRIMQSIEVTGLTGGTWSTIDYR